MLSPFLSVDLSCETVVAQLKDCLGRAGVRVVQTFDLTSARIGLEGCSCPNHGTSQCNCQLIVLFLYQGQAAPLALTLHGNDGQTWLSLAGHSAHPSNARTLLAVRQALASPPALI